MSKCSWQATVSSFGCFKMTFSGVMPRSSRAPLLAKRKNDPIYSLEINTLVACSDNITGLAVPITDGSL